MVSNKIYYCARNLYFLSPTGSEFLGYLSVNSLILCNYHYCREWIGRVVFNSGPMLLRSLHANDIEKGMYPTKSSYRALLPCDGNRFRRKITPYIKAPFRWKSSLWICCADITLLLSLRYMWCLYDSNGFGDLYFLLVDILIDFICFEEFSMQYIQDIIFSLIIFGIIRRSITRCLCIGRYRQ